MLGETFRSKKIEIILFPRCGLFCIVSQSQNLQKSQLMLQHYVHLALHLQANTVHNYVTVYYQVQHFLRKPF